MRFADPQRQLIEAVYDELRVIVAVEDAVDETVADLGEMVREAEALLVAEGKNDARDDTVADPVGLMAREAVIDDSTPALAVIAALAVRDVEAVPDDDSVEN